jgi:hypothetical protein
MVVIKKFEEHNKFLIWNLLFQFECFKLSLKYSEICYFLILKQNNIQKYGTVCLQIWGLKFCVSRVSCYKEVINTSNGPDLILNELHLGSAWCRLSKLCDLMFVITVLRNSKERNWKERTLFFSTSCSRACNIWHGILKNTCERNLSHKPWVKEKSEGKNIFIFAILLHEISVNMIILDTLWSNLHLQENLQRETV